MKKYFKPLIATDRLAAFFLISSVRIEQLYNPQNVTEIQKGLELLENFIAIHCINHYSYKPLF